MKKCHLPFLSLFLFPFLFCCNIANALELVSPLLATKTIFEKTESYLAKEKAIDLTKYQLVSFSFSYYSQYNKASGQWILFYGCKPVNGIRVTDCGFSVHVSNTATPTFEFIPINV